MESDHAEGPNHDSEQYLERVQYSMGGILHRWKGGKHRALDPAWHLAGVPPSLLHLQWQT